MARLLLVIFFAALAALGAGASKAAVVTNITFPTSGVVPDTGCTEAIAYSGEDHLVFRVTSDGSGGFYDAIHRNIHVTGTGLTTGTSYVLENELNANEHFVGASNFTTVFTDTFVSKGGLPNLIITFVIHTTIDANGNITSDTGNAHTKCTG